MKASQLTLEELYSKPKITPSVEKQILIKSDFSQIDTQYCDKVCKLKCKAYDKVPLHAVEADVLIIQDHQAPRGKYDRRDGQQEEVQKSIINFMVRKAGLDAYRVRILNLLKCVPNAKDFPMGKSPTATTLLKCKPYLWEEIRKANPKVIISLGTATTKALGFKKLSNGRNRGWITTLGKGDFVDTLPDVPVVLTAHPRILSMIRQNAQGSGMWGADYFNVIERDFIKAFDLVSGKYTLKDINETIQYYKENHITFCKSEEDVRRELAKIQALPPQAVISFDTETNTLDPLQVDAKLLTIQFGYRDPSSGQVKAVVIPLWHRKNDYYDAAAVWPDIASILSSDRGKVAHNGKFDILMIYWTTGCRVRNLKFDTMLLLHSISSGNQGCYGLKAATWDYLWQEGYAGYEDLLPALKDIEPEDDVEQAQGEEHE